MPGYFKNFNQTNIMDQPIQIIALTKDQSQVLTTLSTWMNTVESRIAKRNIDEWYTDDELMKKFDWSEKQMQTMRRKLTKGIDYIREGGTFIYRYERINNWLISKYSISPVGRKPSMRWVPENR